MKQRYIDRVFTPVQLFIGQEKSGGIVLAISVIIALALANSTFSAEYFHFFEHHLGFAVDGKSYFDYSILHWINDGLMAVFFFVVGLELKSEFIGGELSDIRQTILPVGAAIGGMVVPACIYLSMNMGADTAMGWGIPMSTDIAFALGVIYLLGNKVPATAKLFLTTLAIVDDLGAVLVIALFYTSDISFFNLGLGFVFLSIMFAANKMGIKNVMFYAVFAIGGVWAAFMLSGIHATIAAVLSAFVIPADTRLDEEHFLRKLGTLTHMFQKAEPNKVRTLEDEQVEILSSIQSTSKCAIPPLQRLEHVLSPFVTFAIMPIFALANAGVNFSGVTVDMIFDNHIALGVMLGLLIGKPIGIVLTSYVLTRTKLAPKNEALTLQRLLGIALLASIGFTMSMFVATLAFKSPTALMQAKIGIFAASIVGGVLGYLILSRCNDKPKDLAAEK